MSIGPEQPGTEGAPQPVAPPPEKANPFGRLLGVLFSPEETFASIAQYGPTYDRAIRVLYDGPYKLITTSRGERLLFDLERDPEETNDLAARDPARADALAKRLDSAMSGMLLAAAGKN